MAEIERSFLTRLSVGRMAEQLNEFGDTRRAMADTYRLKHELDLVCLPDNNSSDIEPKVVKDGVSEERADFRLLPKLLRLFRRG